MDLAARSAALGRMALQVTAYRLRCRECGAEPVASTVDGRTVLACAMHPGAAVDGFKGERVRAREMLVASSSTMGRTYRVLIGIDGSAICTCRGWEQYGHCDHGRQAQEVWMTNDQSMALVPIKVEPPKSILPSESELKVIGLLSRAVVGAAGHAVPAALNSPAKVAAVMLAGFELGVPPMTAMRHIFVVNGKTEPDAQLLAGIVTAREASATFDIVNLTDDTCTMRFNRPTRNIAAEYTYTTADAKKAGLIKPGNPWDKFPKDMLRWAVTKRLCRAYAPDLINSIGVSVSVSEDLDMGDDAHQIIDEDTSRASGIPARMLYSPGDEPEGAAATVTTTPEPGATAMERMVHEVMLAYYGNEEAVLRAMNAEAQPFAIVDALLGGVGEWCEMYPGDEGMEHAVATAKAVKTREAMGGLTFEAAVYEVHRSRAEAGLPFSAAIMDASAPDVQSAVEDDEPPAAADTGTAAPPAEPAPATPPVRRRADQPPLA